MNDNDDIVITGATGVVGWRAVREPLAAGHRVAGVTRSARGRRHVAEQRPRFEASPDEHDRAVRAFAQAVAEGDLDGLVAVLDPDVVWTSDCGGRAIASRTPVHGADRVARAWVALRRKPAIEPAATRSSSTAGSAC